MAPVATIEASPVLSLALSVGGWPWRRARAAHFLLLCLWQWLWRRAPSFPLAQADSGPPRPGGLDLGDKIPAHFIQRQDPGSSTPPLHDTISEPLPCNVVAGGRPLSTQALARGGRRCFCVYDVWGLHVSERCFFPKATTVQPNGLLLSTQLLFHSPQPATAFAKATIQPNTP